MINREIIETYRDISLLFGELNSNIYGMVNAQSKDAEKYYGYLSYIGCLQIESALNCSLNDLKVEIEQVVNDDKIINKAKETNIALIKQKESYIKIRNYDKERKTSAMDDPKQ